MSTSYVPYHPEQQQLLPPALQDWLPQGHLAYFISDTIDSLDLSTFVCMALNLRRMGAMRAA